MFQSILSQRVSSISPKSARFMAGKMAVQGPSGVSNHPPGGHKLFRNIALFVAFPIIAIVAAKCYAEKPVETPRPPFVPYEYLRRRTKRFPWGDGTKTFFHNDLTNPLPDGYIDGYQDDECDDVED